MLAAVAERARANGLAEEARRVVGLLAEPARPYDVWEDFRRRSAGYYALLDGVAPTGRDVAAAAGHLPAELVDRVQTQALDESLLTVSLRGYQAFGARFALAQRRVVLGDEMGLGKTVQAVAVVAHLVARGATHALVVCPASVLENWVRELRAHASLPVHAVHGEDREEAAAAWRAAGGVAVVTFAGLRRAGTEAFAAAAPAVLVVDEAHYVKNPLAKRSVAVAALARTTEHVLLLTGTPMENRVEEFRTLLGYLQPELAARLDAAHGAAGPDAFRHAVAPAYLRRNAEDVLEELPELVQVDEWERLGPVDGAAYREAVAAGSFMAMRRAAFAVEHPEDSAKLRRLVEIAREPAEHRRKGLARSAARDRADVVADALGDLALPPLTGSVPARTRQTIVDDFTAAEDPRVLVSQIDVGEWVSTSRRRPSWSCASRRPSPRPRRRPSRAPTAWGRSRPSRCTACSPSTASTSTSCAFSAPRPGCSTPMRAAARSPRRSRARSTCPRRRSRARWSTPSAPGCSSTRP